MQKLGGVRGSGLCSMQLEKPRHCVTEYPHRYKKLLDSVLALVLVLDRLHLAPVLVLAPDLAAVR